MNRYFFRYALRISLLFFATGISLAQIPGKFNTNKIEKVVQTQDFVVRNQMLHPVVLQAMQRGVQPGAFKNVTHEFKKNVSVKSIEAFSSLKDKMGSDGLLKKADADQLKLSPDSIYLAKNSDLVFQTGQIDDTDYVVYKPAFEDVFKDFNLPLQTVPLTVANTTYAIEGSEVSDEQNGIEYSMKMEFDNKEYTFKKDFKQGKEGKENTTKESFDIKFTVNGYLAYNKPSIEAEYSKNGGYRLVFHADELADLKVEGDLEVDFEVGIPVWEFTIPAEDLGEAKIGVFLVIGAGGKIHFEVNIDQNLSIHSGVHGGTSYYFPTSVHTVNQFDSHCDIDYDLELMELKVWGGVECVANIKVLDYDILKIRARGAMELKFELEDSHKVFAVEVGLKVLLDGKVKKIDKKFTILDKYFMIWRKEEKNFGGYTLQVNEADAYYDRVHGAIFKTQDSTAYVGALTLLVNHSNNTQTAYQGNTMENGVFAMTDIPLVKGDKVQVQIPDSPNPSPEIDASIPFTDINLLYADYFTNEVQGVISERVNTFPKQPQTTENQNQNPVNKAVVKPIGNQNIQNLKPKYNPVIEKLNFKDMLTYTSDIEVIVQKIPEIGQTIKDEKETKGVKNLDKLKGIQKVPNAINKNISKNADKLKPTIKKQVKNMPFGGFEVSNVDIKPQDRVMARINIDGFIVESKFIEADGILYSPMFDENISGNAAQPKFTADNTLLSVTAKRSDNIPNGTLRMVKGVDLLHASAMSGIPQLVTEPNELFSKAKHPVVFFDLTKTLDSNTRANTSEIQTGPWEVNNPYYSPANILPHKIGGHLMEYVGMNYEDRWTGYKKYQETCSACGKDISEKVNPENTMENETKVDPDKLEIPIPELGNIKNVNIKLVQPKLQQIQGLKKM